ncbi:hypothetical protein O181_020011 [Austropuccinia psidii MF-1]|uniref:Uncharacterized protein n=1 Tax=Austropuccinia psidii MF-1 TaxID=1389203 RepID=A0A9Q3GUF4_9BASI|nr:hypothetical protein [Austropuccinia psidii MF-1]
MIMLAVALASAAPSKPTSSEVCTDGLVNPRGAPNLRCDTADKSYICPVAMCHITVGEVKKGQSHFKFNNFVTFDVRSDPTILNALHPIFFKVLNDKSLVVNTGWYFLPNGTQQYITARHVCLITGSPVNSIRARKSPRHMRYSLALPVINYGILIWGYSHEQIVTVVPFFENIDDNNLVHQIIS